MNIILLLKQLWNERKSNTWLFTELLLVFVVLWYIVDWAYVSARTYYEPVGFDIENTYLMRLSVKTDKCSTYNPDTLHSKKAGLDVLEIVNRLRRLPEVEAIAISQNSRPYTGSNSSISLRVDTLSVTMLRRPVTKDFFRVFRYENVDGSGWQKLSETLDKKQLVVSENFLPLRYKGDRTLLNREVSNLDDSTEVYRIGAVTKKVRYNDFWSNYGDRYAAVLITEEEMTDLSPHYIGWVEFSIRVKPGTDAGFAERIMKASDAQYSVGNVFILNIKPYSKIRESFQISSVNEVRTRMWMIAFLLVNIFLGIIGTFWLRTQQRRAELGLRMAMGSTRRGLWTRLNGEGLLLLTIAMLPALIICYTIGHADLTDNWNIDWSILRLLIGAIVTFILMALMIVVGIWYPAWQAMNIQPAEALHEE